MIQPLIQWLTSHGKQALGEKDKQQLFQAFMELETRLVGAEQRLQSFTGGSTSTSGSNFAIKHIFLNANYAVPIPTEPVNTLLLYVFTHDDTANVYVVTWPPPFDRMAQPYQGANLVTFFLAFKRSTALIQPAAAKFGGFPLP